MMITHRGFSAWIVCGETQETFPEYLVAVDAKAHQVSCWIAGEEGQTFSLYWRDHGSKVDTCSFITLDGLVVPGRFLSGSGIAWRGSVRSGDVAERPFKFSTVVKEGAGCFEEGPSDLGTITLRIKRIEKCGNRPANTIQNIPEPRIGYRKPGDLYVGFGEEKPAYPQYSSTWSVKAYHKDKLNTGKPSTYVSFVFRYRSRDFLQAQGIMNVPVYRPIASAPVTPVASAPTTRTPTPSHEQGNSERSRSLPTSRHTKELLEFSGEGLIRFKSVPPDEAAVIGDGEVTRSTQ